MRMGFALTTGMLALLVMPPALAEEINVPGDYDFIYDAVQAANPGDVVLVGPGTFTDCTHETEGPGSTPACVIMKSGVTLRGSGPEVTIIDAGQIPPDGDGRGIFIENVSDCLIEDLQVRGGFAEAYGAGILIRNVGRDVVLSNLKITGNFDGGVSCKTNASPVLNQIHFIDNEAKFGGGLSLEQGCDAAVIYCIIEDNTAPLAAGILIDESNPYIRDCLIQNNICDTDGGDGGGLKITNSNPEIIGCQILNNVSTAKGGGIAYLSSTGGGGTLSYTTIKGNTATNPESLGGGLYCEGVETEMFRVTVVENQASVGNGDGGGIACLFTPSPTLINCTLSNNAAATSAGAGGIYCEFGAIPVFDKCIVAFSTTGQAMVCNNVPIPPNPTVSCSDIFGNADGDALCGTDGGDNFSLDPMFCGTASIEYFIETTSPCAPGNHPGEPSACQGELIGSGSVGCSPTAVGETPLAETRLLGNTPNPFNPSTSIFFELAQPGPATLRIYDLNGRVINAYEWDHLAIGRHEVVWHGKDQAGRGVASGVYLYELHAHGTQQTQRMSLIR